MRKKISFGVILNEANKKGWKVLINEEEFHILQRKQNMWTRRVRFPVIDNYGAKIYTTYENICNTGNGECSRRLLSKYNYQCIPTHITKKYAKRIGNPSTHVCNEECNKTFHPFPLNPKYKINYCGTMIDMNGNILKYYTGGNGLYFRKSLSINGENRYTSVHIAVAITFVPNQNGYLYVYHRDGNKKNNIASNLYWSPKKKRNEIVNSNSKISGCPNRAIKKNTTRKSNFVERRALFGDALIKLYNDSLLVNAPPNSLI